MKELQKTDCRPSDLHSFSCSDSLLWPNYRRAVDLVLLGHPKRHPPKWDKTLADHVSQPPGFQTWATFIACTIRSGRTQTKAECLVTTDLEGFSGGGMDRRHVCFRTERISPSYTF